MYSIFFYYAGWIYILSLCLEVFIILRYKAYKTANTRLLIYSVVAITLPALIVLLLIELDSIGETVFRTCFIESGSIGQMLDLIFSLIMVLLLIASYFLIKYQLGCCYAPVFHHLTRVILVFIVTVALSRVFASFILLEDQYFSGDSSAPMILGSISTVICTFIVASSRIVHPKVRSRLREIFCKEEEEEQIFESTHENDKNREQLLKSILSISLDAASDDLADMFEHLGHKIIVQILVLLTIRYTDECCECANLEQALGEYRGSKKKMNFSEMRYKMLSIDLCMPFIDKVYCSDVSLIEYEAGIFEMVCKSLNFDKETMLNSLLSYENLQALAQINNKGGKSNSFFYTSSNEKIVIKTINWQECSSFLKFLPAYCKRVVQHPESKLIRILGMFRILPHKQDFIIMENAIVKRETCLIYDLKGSTVDRYVGGINSEDPPCGIVLKDLNFKRLDKKIKLKNRDETIKVLMKDMKILKNCRLMDYSMLVGIYDENVNTRYAFGEKYSVAIIDFFQRYGFKKSMERIIKRYILRKTKGISAISPERYYKRIKRYLDSITEEADS